MSVIRIGSVDVRLVAAPIRKRTNETAPGTVEIHCRNFSVCPVEVRLRDLGSADPRVAAVSSNAALPSVFTVQGRLNRRSARPPYEVREHVGTWTVMGPAGDADIRAECDGSQGGIPIPGSNGQTVVGVKVEP